MTILGIYSFKCQQHNVPIRVSLRIYQTEEEPHMGRKADHARGKVLGGSSSINGMIYQRGNPMDEGG